MNKISVIIPNFNNAQWLPVCIDSCLQQQGNFTKEIIIVDDHSSDNSLEILEGYKKRYPNEISIYTNFKKGGNSARNYGFIQSSGDFIQWLDSDDQLLPDKFKFQLNVFENNPSADIVFSDWRMDFYNEEKRVINNELIIRNTYEDFLALLLQNKLWNVPNTYLMKREICKKTIEAEGWDENTKVGQDREFFTIAAILGAKFYYCPGLFSTYNRWSNETVSTKYKEEEIAKESLRLNHKFYNTVKDSKVLKNKVKYFRILNAELLNALYHHPKLGVPRYFSPWRFSMGSLHWKMRWISPALYFYHLFKAKEV